MQVSRKSNLLLSKNGLYFLRCTEKHRGLRLKEEKQRIISGGWVINGSLGNLEIGNRTSASGMESQ